MINVFYIRICTKFANFQISSELHVHNLNKNTTPDSGLTYTKFVATNIERRQICLEHSDPEFVSSTEPRLLNSVTIALIDIHLSSTLCRVFSVFCTAWLDVDSH